ncbi:cyclic nucleotide-binding domain protein (macronuclear) [Tetrahymena thermophila SB210]|uniref:Cyclic nucleotide-binding domain protein n=1 Tax=Tetrahymena thermophila (strain SB210) TaxID=312017 RepID=Q23W17_TETTS|nr:cyclic nucleotide-binding domain protein [Tetrahymena thermophila SB210]EAS00688.2 cyclic nucleotide-binding domain protein [Tetrahymena thermophila SB210]|eukprot:XP_001020933.2 cyclic nucleotide-binding domain protein [Tetrahymena thermophila SB210]
MSSTNEGSNFVPRKLNPYENELQFEYQRLHTNQTQNMMKKNNVQQGPNLQVISILQNYPDKLNEKPIYDSKQQQFLIIKDQETDQEQDKEKDQSVQLTTAFNPNQYEVDDLSGDLLKKKNQKDLHQGSVRLTDEANFVGSPIDLRKIQYEEDDLKRQQNINNIIMEIDKNERAVKKLKYIWPYSKLENHKLQDIQEKTNEYFRNQNNKILNQTVKNSSNIQWDEFDKMPPSSSHQRSQSHTRRRSSLNKEKKSSQLTQEYYQNEKPDNFESIRNNNNNNKMIQTQYSFSINPHDKQNLNRSKENDNPKTQAEVQENINLEDNNSSFLSNTHAKQKFSEMTEQRGKLESKEGLRNVLLRQSHQKKQEPWQIMQYQKTLPDDRNQVIQSRGASRYSRSRSQSRNGQYPQSNVNTRQSTQSNQVSPRAYDKDLDNSSRSQSRNGQYPQNNANTRQSTQSNQVSPRVYDKDLDNSFQVQQDFRYNDKTLMNKKNKDPINHSYENRVNNINYFEDDNIKRTSSQNQQYKKTYQNYQNESDEDNVFKRQLPNEDGRRTVYYDDNNRRSINNEIHKKQNTLDPSDYQQINNNRQNTLKSRAQSRQKSRQASPLGANDDQSNYYKNSTNNRVKTQQDYLPRIKNGNEKELKTEANYIENEDDQKETNFNQKRKNSQPYGESFKGSIKFSDPYIQKQLIEFENEQRSQNNEIDEGFIKQEQLDKMANYVKNFNQTTRGNRQFRTLEDKRNIKTSQNTHRTLDQGKNNEQSLEKDDFRKRRNSGLNQTLKQQRAHSKNEVREKTPVDNKVRYSVQNDQFKETLKSKRIQQQDLDRLMRDDFDDFEKDAAQKSSKQRSPIYKNNNQDDSDILGGASQMDKDILKKQQLINILNSNQAKDVQDSNLSYGNSKFSKIPSTAKKPALKNRMEGMQDSELTQKKDNYTENSSQQPSSVYFKGKQNDKLGMDVRRIFEDIEKRKKIHRLDDKETQKIYSYGDYTIIHHPKQNSSKLLQIDENSKHFENFQEEFGEQMNDFLDVAIDCHESSKKRLSPLGKYKLPQSPKSPTRNHLNNITNNYKVKKQQQRSKSVLNNVSRGKSSQKQKRQSSKKSKGQVDFDEQKYKLICQRIAVKMTYIPAEYSSRSEQYLRDLLAELKIYNPVFSNISYFTGVNILRLSRIYVYEEDSDIYTENQPSNSSFLILYGRVCLSSKDNGEFKESIMGETIGEEAVLGPEDKNINRFETATAMEETSMCEINREFLEKFRISCSEKGLQDDYMSIVTLLKKNFIQKKTLRLLNAQKDQAE